MNARGRATSCGHCWYYNANSEHETERDGREEKNRKTNKDKKKHRIYRLIDYIKLNFCRRIFFPHKLPDADCCWWTLVRHYFIYPFIFVFSTFLFRHFGFYGSGHTANSAHTACVLSSCVACLTACPLAQKLCIFFNCLMLCARMEKKRARARAHE